MCLHDSSTHIMISHCKTEYWLHFSRLFHVCISRLFECSSPGAFLLVSVYACESRFRNVVTVWGVSRYVVGVYNYCWLKLKRRDPGGHMLSKLGLTIFICYFVSNLKLYSLVYCKLNLGSVGLICLDMLV